MHEQMEQKYPYMMKPSPTHNFYHVVSLNLFGYLIRS